MQASSIDAPTQADRGFVFQVARRIVRDDEEAQDVTQDALLTAYRHRHKFRGDASYRTWLYRIAATAALTSLRRRRSARRKTDALTVEHEADRAPPPPADQLLHERRAHARIAAAIATLEPKYRSVLELRVHHDASEQEIAAALGLSISAVKVRAFRARNMLREILPDDAAR
jgi:RNA polymerase sigma-70 factor (ECF subfamily)